MKKSFKYFGFVIALYFSATAFAETEQTSNYTYMPLAQLKQEAQTGASAAQFYLATRYKNGLGIEQNHKEAFKWFMEAAQQGSKEAQLNVGRMLARGEGVNPNIMQAKQWLQQAAKLGEGRAAYNLAVIEEHDKNLVDALSWYNVTNKLSESTNAQARQRASEKMQSLSSRLTNIDLQRAQERASLFLASLTK